MPLPERRPDPPRQSSPPPLNGPSFLGLGDEPSPRERVSYLLEDDEESSSHRGAYAAVVFILLVAALALGTWRWRPDLFSRLTKLSSSAGTQTTNAVSPSAAAPTSEGSTGGRSPGDESAAQPASPNGPSTTTAPSQATPGATSSTNEVQPAATAPGPANTPAPAQPASGETAPAAQPQEPPASQSTAAEKPKPSRSVRTSDEDAESAAPPTGDALEAEGEKYLYGNGVAENCGRAQRDMMAAANHNNAKAQSVLGTMYATGHCTGRDLPLAYHWFGKALRQDPSNTRIEQDLKALWNQMTPEERNLALHSD